MFCELDNLLISKCQHFVWHIERFTPREKLNVAKLVMTIHMVFFAIFFSLTIITTIGEFSLVTLAVLGSWCYVHFREKKAVERECVSQGNITRALPSAIRTRYTIRSRVMIFTSIVLLTMILMYAESNIEFTFAFYVLSTLLSSSAIFIAFSEYFMCTISLPPGEKERFEKKQEAEKMKLSVSTVSR